ncbi:MAG: hypothetical protein MR009_01705 [Sutterellaceae bacterium]|nr:hypothetical protein [Sutterellaceae bacterium]MDY2868215.1 hypothetical protein [Mesosutterella sp.]
MPQDPSSGFRKSLRFITGQGTSSLEARLALSRKIVPAVSAACRRRFLPIDFSAPGQVRITDCGTVRLIVKTQSQAYRMKNLLPTLRKAVETALGEPVAGLEIAVNPELGKGLSGPEAPMGTPRKPNPAAAAAIRERAGRLPEGSVTRRSLEELADALEERS